MYRVFLCISPSFVIYPEILKIATKVTVSLLVIYPCSFYVGQDKKTQLGESKETHCIKYMKKSYASGKNTFLQFMGVRKEQERERE